MYLFVAAVHIILCLLLVLVILLQPGKGGDFGGGFGGGASASIFGPQGPTNLLQRATAVVAAMFMVTSVTMAWYSSRSTLSNADVQDELERIQSEREAKKLEAEAAPADDGAPSDEVPPADQAAPGGEPQTP